MYTIIVNVFYRLFVKDQQCPFKFHEMHSAALGHHMRRYNQEPFHLEKNGGSDSAESNI